MFHAHMSRLLTTIRVIEVREKEKTFCYNLKDTIQFWHFITRIENAQQTKAPFQLTENGRVLFDSKEPTEDSSNLRKVLKDFLSEHLDPSTKQHQTSFEKQIDTYFSPLPDADHPPCLVE